MTQFAPIPDDILRNLNDNQQDHAKSAPLIYAENIIGLAVGPFVSKVILGLENPPHLPTPTIQISMPTNALHGFAKQVMEVLSNKETQDQIGNAFKEYQDSALPKS